jgi:hypothetical protein
LIAARVMPSGLRRSFSKVQMVFGATPVFTASVSVD